ncbi:MAG: bifunctional UDP-N-acetylglucosamine diphosphorylase/glucosamine-1-phosphate N-acetyltransferase GlmU, partial [Alphaproteobacteria bacterium]|nr:bifunctional UDP-N-acetylglucosamine diphosphorylase/glucosamine-1-phosphate N-acetyltransferase GlmU [Alphaproteobacteria bacterium]
MPHPIATIVLAAGKGTRMNSDLPKVLHKIAGRSMIGHVLAALEPLGPERRVVVISPNQNDVAKAVAPATIAVQPEALGTGDAARAAMVALVGFTGTVLVAFGGDPMFTTRTLRRLAEAREVDNPPDVVVLGFQTDNPDRYGRLLQDSEGGLEAIVEASEAHTIDRPVRLYNAGIMAIDGAKLFGFIDALNTDNAKGEYYLTDLPRIAQERGGYASVVEAPEVETMGVDTRADLARAEALMQARLRTAAMEAGVTLVAPETVFFSHDTVIGRDSIVHPNVTFGLGVSIGTGVEIKSFCHLETASVADAAIIGPYARLRPGAEIGIGAHVGNFVEIKAATIGAGAKVNHLSYIGDTTVGVGANIGAGTITCNYDGFSKFRTEIGAGAFIGSNTALVAPICIGDGAIIGAGSTMTKSVEADALAVVRGGAEVVSGGAARFRSKRRKTSLGAEKNKKRG